MTGFSTKLRQGLAGLLLVVLAVPAVYGDAPAVKFTKPTKIVCIGDDTWSEDRANNPAAIMQKALESANPGLVKVETFAVGGDILTNLEARFNQQPVLDWTKYWPLLNSKPDWVFLQLGGNDTRSRSLNQFKTAFVTPDLQAQSLPRLLTAMKRIWPNARIVLLTSVPCDAAAAAEQAKKALQNGAPDVWRMGDAEKLTVYNQAMKAAAEKFGLGFLDIYGIFQKRADLKTLWAADHVHLTPDGRQILAQEILTYLAANQELPVSAAPVLPAAGDLVFRMQKKDFPKERPWCGAPAVLPDQNGSGRNLLMYGNFPFSPEGALQMDGSVAGLVLEDSTAFSAEKGVTFVATVRNTATMHAAEKRMFSSYFYKPGQILFCRVDNQLYFNCFVNGNWGGGFSTGDVFEEPYGKESFHQVVLTARHHKVVSQGEDWVEVHFYVDGEPCGQKKLLGISFPDSPFPLECGSASSLGYMWRFKGDAAEYRIYHRVLNDSEVEDLAAAEPLLKRKGGDLQDAEVQQLLKKLPPQSSRYSVVENLVASGMDAAQLKTLLSTKGTLMELPGKESTLTVLTAPGKARIVSWFDNKAKRELLTHDSPMFTAQAKINGAAQNLSPLSADAASDLVGAPVKKDGRWEFTIRTRFAQNADATAETRYSFGADQLRYEVTLDAGKSGWAFTTLQQPALRLRPFTSGKDNLLVPIMSGVEYPGAAKEGASYQDNYPHGTAAMQLGAYYDPQGGIYWTVLDPRARYKMLNSTAGGKRVVASMGWVVPGKTQEEQKHFTPEVPAVLELFRGNWYDVGLLYRRDLAAMKAYWWRESLPNTDTPEWFRENCFILRKLQVDDITRLEPMRDYFGMPYTIAYGSGYSHNSYSPFYRLNQMDIAYAEYVHQLGLHAYPYTDPRLWSHNDRRDEDWQYTSLGKNSVIIEDGREFTENYGTTVCSITCPATAAVQKITVETLKLMTDQGFDGLYCDQIGAAAPHLCENPDHGHVIRDPDAYYRDGWYKIFMDLRKEWKKQGDRKIIVTEDNAEHCVQMLDGMLPWRWMYDHQVPLYPMIYAGRTQFTGREPDCEEPDAIFVKAAIQLVNSEQMGWIESGLVVSPLRHDYRVFLRQLLWLRKALLPFFNEGMMARPPRFAQELKIRPLKWGVRGTGVVTSPDIVSSAWTLGKDHAFILVNHTMETQNNAMLYTLPEGRYTLTLWQSDQAEAKTLEAQADLKLDFSLPPHASLLVLAVPQGSVSAHKDAMEKAFAEVRRSPAVADPFVVDLQAMANADAGTADKVHNASDFPDGTGCRLNREHNQVDYVRDALLSIGEVDFGEGGYDTITAVFAAPARCGSGRAEFYVDDVSADHCFAKFLFDGACFMTKNWDTFESRTAPVDQPVTGKHRVFVKLQGSSFCNFRSWNLTKGGNQ